MSESGVEIDLLHLVANRIDAVLFIALFGLFQMLVSVWIQLLALVFHHLVAGDARRRPLNFELVRLDAHRQVVVFATP